MNSEIIGELYWDTETQTFFTCYGWTMDMENGTCLLHPSIEDN